MKGKNIVVGNRVFNVELKNDKESGLADLTVKELGQDHEGEAYTLHGVEILFKGSKIEVLSQDGSVSGTISFENKDKGEVCLNGKRYHFKDDDTIEGQEEEGEAEAGPDILAPMPGRVVKLLVSIGDEVKKGEALMIVESMKMETRICSGLDGKVKAINVEAETKVNPGDILVTVEPDQ